MSIYLRNVVDVSLLQTYEISGLWLDPFGEPNARLLRHFAGRGSNGACKAAAPACALPVGNYLRAQAPSVDSKKQVRCCLVSFVLAQHTD